MDPTADSDDDGWRAVLQEKTYVMEAWDCKDDPCRYIQAMFLTFGIEPDVSAVNTEWPELFVAPLARQHGLFLYDPPTIEGSDVYGFILSDAQLDGREIQQIEANYWGQEFDEVYDPSL